MTILEYLKNQTNLESEFQTLRRSYQLTYPSVLKEITKIDIELVDSTLAEVSSEVKNKFKNTYSKKAACLKSSNKKTENNKLKKVGVVLSGGQAPGGHNVICGLYDALVENGAELYGFRMGPDGILKNDSFLLEKDYVDRFRNTGGFNMLGSGRGKIESDSDLKLCKKILEENNFDTLVIIGGDDSNTNAAIIAEYLKSNGNDHICVVGVPKTIDGDLQNQYVEISFGFDSATKLYSELISNICRDAISAKKYYHFIRLMGRAASHITLECALQTRPNIALISEEAAKNKMTLKELVAQMGEAIIKRSQKGLNYGVVLIPEGLIEQIPEFSHLISELNQLLVDDAGYIDTLGSFSAKSEYINKKLNKDASYTLSSIPMNIQRQLFFDRDPHGNVQVSRIETEKLLLEMLEAYLDEKKAKGQYKGKFNSQTHFLGYEGRCVAPTNFDANYCYALGRTAAAVAWNKISGYMVVISGLMLEYDKWQPKAIPISSMMALEMRHGMLKPVITKALVQIDHPSMKCFIKNRNSWLEEDNYRYVGSIQYFGPKEICDQPPIIVQLDREEQNYE